MRRFDRATYVLFLLILMADVARTSASVPVGGGAGGGMTLTGASQPQIRPNREMQRAVKNADAPSPRIAQIRNVRLRLSQWPTTVPMCNGALLAGVASLPDPEGAGSFGPGGIRLVPSSGIFEHTGSPAP